MKKVKLSIVYRIVRGINLFLNEKASPTDEARVLLALVNLEKDTKYRLETFNAFNALFMEQVKAERANHINSIQEIDKHFPKRVIVSDMIVKDAVFLSPINQN
jgi:hypothetical protein